MKRALGILLALAMVIGFGAFTFDGAAAAEKNDEQGAKGQIRGGEFKIAGLYKKEGRSDQPAPRSKEVIVLFETSESAELSTAEEKKLDQVQIMSAEGSSAKGSTKVEITDGITVNKDEVWSFEGEGRDETVTVAVASSSSLSTNKMIRKLSSEKIVRAVSPNYARHIYAEGSDPFRDHQWALDAYPGISADAEWSSGNTGDDGSIVAVVDTGIDYGHEDLNERMWKNPYGSKLKGKYGFDMVNGDTNPMDDNGHGTHCAGIIGAATNGTGVQGVNQAVQLMALKVFDADGEGYDSDIIAAFNYIYKAMELGANVTTINCSFGGEDENEILTEIIDKLGEKGAVSVCAAGNEAIDCDEMPSYPACCDSEYVISVAAAKKAGDKAELVSFSNYGEENVDVAAPGTDILSTVCYESFNPTLYGTDENIVQRYYDGSQQSQQDLAEELAATGLTNMDPGDIVYDGPSGFLGSDGALKIHFDPSSIDTTKYKWQYFAIPYDLPDDYNRDEDDVASSLMIRTAEGPKDLNLDQLFSGTYDKVMLMDVPRALLDESTSAGAKFLKTAGEDLLFEYYVSEQLVAGDDDYWTHLEMRLHYAADDSSASIYSDGEDEEIDVSERAILILGDSQAGAFNAYIDDIGVSQCLTDTSCFGKYDFYSGTSMAAPYVAGAVALTAAAEKGGEKPGPEKIIGDVLTTANDQNPLPVSTEGSVDFANKENGFWIGLGPATVVSEKGAVLLNGRFGTGESGSLQIRIRKTGEKEWQTVDTGDILSEGDSQILIRDRGWINNVVDIEVTGTKGEKTKKAVKRGVYLVKGKKEYDVLSESGSLIAPGAALATNGSRIYAACSDGDAIQMINPGTINEGAEEVAIVTKRMIEKYFKAADPKKLSKSAKYDFRFGDDLVLIGGDLYVTGSFCEVTASEESDNEEDWSRSTSAADSGFMGDDDDDNEMFGDTPGAAYTEERCLLKVNISSGTVSKLPLPAGTDMLSDVKLASYNGGLYMMGGLNESEGSFSSKVFAYNASGKKWTSAAALPEGRAGGKVLQTGNRLVYTLGYDAHSEITDTGYGQTPANYIFDGRKWTAGSARLEPIAADVLERGVETYPSLAASVGICREGLVFMAAPAADYGDTFIYDAAKDKYAATHYNFAQKLDDIYDMQDGAGFNGLAVGSSIIGFNRQGEAIGLKNAVRSGLVKVTAAKAKGAKVTGAGAFMPGTSRTVKATASPGYYVKSLTFAGKKGTVMAKGMKATALVTKDVTAKAVTAKLKVSSVKSLTLKRGKSASLKARITPGAAAKQWKLAYKSSNTKYATVNAKGVVKASKKKAAKGKTVKIMIRLKGTNKTLKTVKVKIKK